MDNWKQEIADQASAVVEHEIVQDVCRELADNLHLPFDGLYRCGIEKVALYAATVARAEALGIDPDLLRLTGDEARSELLRLAAEAVTRGVPTHLIEGETS